MKKYFIKTYGCQMNKNDSERLAGVLDGSGYQPTEEKNQADIILVNTCCVRENAENKALGFVAGLKRQKKKRNNIKIVF
ncbi:MAG: tRNA (N6-isopentenyl adenosine(37)-C2)-methylthiotransferase MiaB, partial [Candidatus Margulisbacteria bacterium]|nr:tRNA (N6-isopentenyl adenosine(37)-C2)-methylthiotransferase MiaB [Candidatus Margulisiibacteriota bacterium]